MEEEIKWKFCFLGCLQQVLDAYFLVLTVWYMMDLGMQSLGGWLGLFCMEHLSLLRYFE